ncbi:MAG: tetratricopeptide repeat protein, partial [Syntrophothermus sp.]
EKVVEKDPGHAEAYFNLGMTYLQLGDKNSALSEYEVLKKLNPDLAKKLADSINK